jgi:hypothetical protein
MAVEFKKMALASPNLPNLHLMVPRLVPPVETYGTPFSFMAAAGIGSKNSELSPQRMVTWAILPISSSSGSIF